jgi:hypothetical protein
VKGRRQGEPVDACETTAGGSDAPPAAPGGDQCFVASPRRFT